MGKSRELLVRVTKKDLTITWYSGSGAGGQHRNKHPNCCRIKHEDSGVMVTAGEQRSREQNLRKAFNRLANHKDFRSWLHLESSKAAQDKKEVEKQIQTQLKEAMREENLKVEYFTPAKT